MLPRKPDTLGNFSKILCLFVLFLCLPQASSLGIEAHQPFKHVKAHRQQSVAQLKGDDVQDRYQMNSDMAEAEDRSIEGETVKRIVASAKKVDENKKTQDPSYRKDPKDKPITPREHQDKETLYVHLIAHTHDDVGWIKTIDEYYSGTKQDAQHATIYLILDTVVDELLKDPRRKFTYVEMKFFTMWYWRQTPELRTKVKKLVKEGRLEFANGGWSATDEACTNYEDIINNMVKGHQFLKSEFGVVPRIGWHLDAFGHSSTNARIFAEFGFEAQFFARLDREDKEARVRKHGMDFLWRPFNKHFGAQKQILTSIFRDHYCWIPDFQVNDNDAFEPDETLESFNGEERMRKFINYIHEKIVPAHRGNHVALPWGCDFAWYDARQNFHEMEKLINYTNTHNKVNMKLVASTPQTFVNALKKQNLVYDPQYHDMFPYSDEKNDFWSGFFTSRPTMKKQVKDGSANFHASSKLFAQKVINLQTSDQEVAEILEAKEGMMDALGVYQHHDAITGTDAQYVAQDYNFRLSKAMLKSNDIYKRLLGDLMEKNLGFRPGNLSTCIGSSNDTVLDCPVSEPENEKKNSFLLAVHNPSAYKFTNLLRVRVPSQKCKVELWMPAQKQFVDVAADVIEQKHFSNKRVDYVDFEMFIPCQIEPNEVAYAKISKIDEPKETTTPTGDAPLSLSVEGVSEDGDILFQFTNKAQGFAQRFGFNLKYYQSHKVPDYRDRKNYADGAYLFKPDLKHLWANQYSTLDADVGYEQGQFVSQWTVKYFNATTQEAAYVKVRFSEYFDEIIEFEVELSEVPVKEQGKDVTVNWRFFDNFEANKTFWTDSNGLEMQERRLNYNPGYNWYSDKQNISSNYYPVDSAIAMRDLRQNRQVTILNDRAQGGSADLTKSTIELMQHRRLTQDDNKGVQEILNETDSSGAGIKVNARYYVHIFDMLKGFSKQREQQLRIDTPLQYFYAFDFEKEADDKEKLQASETLVRMNEIINGGATETLAYRAFPLARNQILLRFENLADKFDTKNSFIVRYLDLQKFARQFFLEANHASHDHPLPTNIKIEELTLSGNELMADRKEHPNFKWKGSDDKFSLHEAANKQPTDHGDQVALEPQRIRHFKITYNPSPKEIDLHHLPQKAAIQQAVKQAQPQPKQSIAQASVESDDPEAPQSLEGTSGQVDLVQIH